MKIHGHICDCKNSTAGDGVTLWLTVSGFSWRYTNRNARETTQVYIAITASTTAVTNYNKSSIHMLQKQQCSTIFAESFSEFFVLYYVQQYEP